MLGRGGPHDGLSPLGAGQGAGQGASRPLRDEGPPACEAQASQHLGVGRRVDGPRGPVNLALSPAAHGRRGHLARRLLAGTNSWAEGTAVQGCRRLRRPVGWKSTARSGRGAVDSCPTSCRLLAWAFRPSARLAPDLPPRALAAAAPPPGQWRGAGGGEPFTAATRLFSVRRLTPASSAGWWARMVLVRRRNQAAGRTRGSVLERCVDVEFEGQRSPPRP